MMNMRELEKLAKSYGSTLLLTGGDIPTRKGIAAISFTPSSVLMTQGNREWEDLTSDEQADLRLDTEENAKKLAKELKRAGHNVKLKRSGKEWYLHVDMSDMLESLDIVEGTTPQGLARDLIQRFGGETIEYMPSEIKMTLPLSGKPGIQELDRALAGFEQIKSAGKGMIRFANGAKGEHGAVEVLVDASGEQFDMVVRDFREEKDTYENYLEEQRSSVRRDGEIAQALIEGFECVRNDANSDIDKIAEAVVSGFSDYLDTEYVVESMLGPNHPETQRNDAFAIFAGDNHGLDLLFYDYNEGWNTSVNKLSEELENHGIKTKVLYPGTLIFFK